MQHNQSKRRVQEVIEQKNQWNSGWGGEQGRKNVRKKTISKGRKESNQRRKANEWGKKSKKTGV